VAATRFRLDGLVPAATIWYGDPEIKSDAYRLWYALVDLDELGAAPGETTRVIQIRGPPAQAIDTRGLDVVTAASLNDPAPRPLLVRGDANDDGAIDVSDAVFMLLALFRPRAQPGCADALDSNDDGRNDISDPIRLLGFLFRGAPSPPPPFPDCGADMTADGLGCRVHAACP
jgi:hypothetical protein